VSLQELVPRALRGATAYHVPRPEGVRAKLDANESPWPLPADAAEALGRELAERLRAQGADRLIAAARGA
jgi:histidinol-phosphate/aromatic aminotransferase/cobyric acid decarboxylase-like protein